MNGNYLGVSWWWRDIEVPRSFAGRRATLTIRGARLRAEVYWNETLVGYNIITETSFSADVTSALRPGVKNRLAIRITNPGGRLDWVDTQLLTWGTLSFHKSHGFGGLDRGLILSAHDPLFLEDEWVLNTPALRTVRAHARLRNSLTVAGRSAIAWEILDPFDRSIVIAN